MDSNKLHVDSFPLRRSDGHVKAAELRQLAEIKPVERRCNLAALHHQKDYNQEHHVFDVINMPLLFFLYIASVSGRGLS